MISTEVDVGFIIRGKGNSGRNNYMRAPTTLLIRGASTGYGLRWYGNGARDGALENLELSYDSSSFTGDQVDNFGAPGFCTRRVSFDSFGKTGATVLYTARSNISLAYEEFFYPKECTFNGADISILSNTSKVVARFTASIIGTTMTVTGVAEGALEVGQIIFDTPGIAAGTTIVPGGTGTGGTGTYTVSISQTLSSRDMKTNLAFGGSCTEIDATNIFYDCANKYVQHDGLKPRLGFSFSGIINPIRRGHYTSIDLRNVQGMKISDTVFHGSVGYGPSNMSIYLENCVGEVCNNMMGPSPLMATFANCALTVSGNRISTSAGIIVNGCAIRGGANRFSTVGSYGWYFPQNSGSVIDLSCDIFDAGVTASYNFQGSTGTNNTKGRILRSSVIDASTSGATTATAASGVTVTSV